MIQSLTASFSVSTLELPLPEKWAVPLRKAFPGTWYIQLRSLNQRFWELSCQLPEFATELEIPLRKLLQQKLLRGRVECRLSYDPDGLATDPTTDGATPANGKAAPNAPGAELEAELLRFELRQLIELQQRAKDFGLELPHPDSLQLLQHCRLRQEEWQQAQQARQLPKASPESTVGGWQDALLEFCRRACEQLLEARRREGKELYHELLVLHQSFVEQCQRAQQWEKEVPKYFLRQLLDKYQQLQDILSQNSDSPRVSNRTAAGVSNGGSQLSSERLLGELSLFLAKGDVREELSRLRIHAQGFFDILQNAGQAEGSPTGTEPVSCAKELDFLLQEMNREANTLGSKSPVIELQQIAVKLKVLIEQMREQTRNVL